VPGGNYTNSNQLVYVPCTDPTARDISLPQPGIDQRMLLAGATSKCVDLDAGTSVDLHVSGSDTPVQCQVPPTREWMHPVSPWQMPEEFVTAAAMVLLVTPC
jgi:hypothetical protein